jgi:hypothetical protein
MEVKLSSSEQQINQSESLVLSNTMGKESLALKYHGGMIFVDNASSFNFLINQTSLRAGETLQAEIAFERLDQTCGHKIRSFRADKMPFQSNEFKSDLIPKGATFGECDHIPEGVV